MNRLPDLRPLPICRTRGCDDVAMVLVGVNQPDGTWVADFHCEAHASALLARLGADRG